MNAIRRVRRFAAALAGLAAALVAFGATPAFARLQPDSGVGYVAPTSVPAQIQYRTIVVADGMPGWQIALIAVGAALLATVAVLADRARAPRRRAVPAAA